jgi:hypothetical protein
MLDRASDLEGEREREKLSALERLAPLADKEVRISTIQGASQSGGGNVDDMLLYFV